MRRTALPGVRLAAVFSWFAGSVMADYKVRICHQLAPLLGLTQHKRREQIVEPGCFRTKR
jgi:hypothetical protein